VNVFFDTNVLVYGQLKGVKADRARTLLGAGGMVSVQVLNEFISVLSRKLRLPWSDIEAARSDVLDVLDPPLALTLETNSSALALARDHHLNFYDALVLSSAITAKCVTLYTEDMQHDRVFGGLRIVNPFGRDQ
jgi:predicted nucleic acid-binding protein